MRRKMNDESFDDLENGKMPINDVEEIVNLIDRRVDFWTNCLIALFIVAMAAVCVLMFVPYAFGEPTNEQMIEMMKAQYTRDVKTVEGRKKWHGNIVQQVVNTNALIRVDTHADGTMFTNTWRNATLDAQEREAKRLANMTNNVPQKLAQARLRREMEKKQKAQQVVIETVVGRDDIEEGSEGR